ncbi:MAG: LON peptidase substrate-binding domain-containing protein, partial [Chloroflexota bacterium]
MMPDMMDPKASEGIQVPEELALLPSKDAIVFPHMLLPMAVTGEQWVKLLEEASTGPRVIGLFALKDENGEAEEDNFYRVGSAVAVVRLVRIPDGSVQVLLQGLARIEVTEFTQQEPYPRARIRKLEETAEKTTEMEAMQRNLAALFQRAVSISPTLPNELAITAANLPEPGRLSDFVASALNVSLAER